jgi:hypothetical protein
LTQTLTLPPYPPTTPEHDCRQFTAPEGTYKLGHSIFVHSMQPLYSVGTTASLVSIKYKETITNNLQRYEAQPGARSFRRIFSGSNASTTTESDEEHVFRTPSLSSSSSSHNNTNNKSTPLSHSIPEEPVMDPVSPTPTSTLSFLARNHTIGGNTRHPRKPKTSITKTNSSFVQRIITNDQLAKILMARTSDDTNLFYNCGTSFVWVDAGGHPKVKKKKNICVLYII